ncbi:hypothetical protein Dip510_000060 [Elusimicrobium posterum]|uniref:hypothetical protein n=1 Tax=Elusimicrobium posterum TaxID=3116653 RepID=UPI003C785ABD
MEIKRVEITLVGKKDNVGLNIVLPLFKTLYEYTLYGKEYYIAYFNDNTFIFNSRLSSFTTVEQRDNDLVTMTLTLEVAPKNQKDETAKKAAEDNSSDTIGK